MIVFGQPELLHHLAMQINADLKSRITCSVTPLLLNEYDLEAYIQRALEFVKLGINTFDDGAIELILRNAQGNLRRSRHLCYVRLVEACQQNKMTVTIRHVNHVLIQPHWRSHEELIQQQVYSCRALRHDTSTGIGRTVRGVISVRRAGAVDTVFICGIGQGLQAWGLVEFWLSEVYADRKRPLY